MQDLSEFKTSDLALASFLKLEGYKILQVVKKNTRTAEFYFQNVKREDLISYQNGSSTVEPRDFASQMRQLNQTARMVVRDN